MARLIDADLLKKNIAKWLQGGDPQETEMVKLDDIAVSIVMEIEEQPTAFDVEKCAALIYDLLNEYDIGLWRDITYIDLAEMWVDAIDNKTYDEDKLKEKIKEFIVRRDGIDERFN